jgi:hypothetical protein
LTPIELRVDDTIKLGKDRGTDENLPPSSKRGCNRARREAAVDSVGDMHVCVEQNLHVA